MPGLSETITRCQEYEKQWINSKARHCSPSLTSAMDITTSALPKRIDTKQPSRHAMELTFQRSCTLGCATHLHSSREPCEMILCHSVTVTDCLLWTDYNTASVRKRPRTYLGITICLLFYFRSILKG